MTSLLKKLWEDESGQALVEYGMVVALAVVAATAVFVAFREKLTSFFTDVGNQMQVPK